MRRLAPLLLFAATATVSGSAQAKCMMPSPALVPPSGKIPSGAKLRLLVPQFTSVKKPLTVTARLGNKSVPVVVTKLDTPPAELDAYLVQLGVSAPGAPTLELPTQYGSTTWSLDVDPGWKAPAIAKETPTVGHVVTSWTCSHERSRQLAFKGGVDGYRVLLGQKKEDFADPKKLQSVYLPSSPRAFFGAPIGSSTADLRLGFLNCFGETYTFTTTTMLAEVRALLPDGTEPVVTPAPISVSAP